LVSASAEVSRVWAAAASPLIGATVSYYYVMPHDKPDFSKITGPVLGHFDRDDQFVSLADARALEAELSADGVDTTFEFYENAGHAFYNTTNRLGTCNPDLAARSSSAQSRSCAIT
jgi:dienelactone hydrolase